MQQKSPICALIDSWPTRKHLADEIGAKAAAVHKWAAAGRIPADWQGVVVRAARKIGLSHVTAEWMLEKHSRDSGMATILSDDVLPDGSPALDNHHTSLVTVSESVEIPTSGAA